MKEPEDETKSGCQKSIAILLWLGVLYAVCMVLLQFANILEPIWNEFF